MPDPAPPPAHPASTPAPDPARAEGHAFGFHGLAALARASGALWLGAARVLVVSDLHLGKSERLARRGGALLPPYEAQDTLLRLQAEIEALQPAHVICLGDSFDDAEAASQLPDGLRDWLLRLMAGRDWSWVEGNHDPGPIGLGGSHRAALRIGAVRFCHQPGLAPGPEVGGHYHPKLRLAGRSHRCFVLAPDRVILPAFGAYTGGLWCHEPPLAGLAGPGALAVLTGARAIAVPLPEPGPEPGPQRGSRAGMRAARGG